ncbi:hypothetical protein [Pseudonocardia nigra]|uniref:hypothetical protein n=1 Tax=Pseudonocardia nigra TaxID=1921578 RepID=UPI001C5F129A|nr:hypothetical protein [Pseudonocardia nigra]
MDAYIKFEGYFTEHIRNGVSVGCPTAMVRLGNDTTVEIPRPFIAIGNNLGITPAIEPDGETSLRIDVTRWSPLRYGHPITAGFPFNFAGQELAVRVTRAFDADPNTSWRDPATAIRLWLRTWLDGQGLGSPLPAGTGKQA